MKIAPVFKIDREKIDAMVILLIIDYGVYGVYVCIFTVYSSVLKKSHDTHSSMTVIFQHRRRLNGGVQ